MSAFRCISFAAWLVAFLTLAVPGPVTAQDLPKAKTIDELAERYDVSACLECHEDQHDEWQQSAHSRSMVGSGSGRTRATFKTLITRGLMTWPHSGVQKPEDVKIEHLMVCARCHLPQLSEATDDVAREIVQAVYAKDNETLSKLSINCLVCHQRNAIIHKWKFGFPGRDEVYGSFNGEHEDEDHPVLKENPVMGQSILCGQCHGLGPGFHLEEPTQCATGYGSYLWAYIPEGGTQTCQDCHMRRSQKGHAMPSYRDPDMQAAAVDMQVDIHAYHWRKNKTDGVIPLASVNVELTNRTGHGIPDG
jgi:cytochrome c553